MTGRFETLIYTDCKPGEGLSGAAGLQFQARSSASASSGEAIMRRAFYEPPDKWMTARRPVEDYPPSYAHVWEGDQFVTAAGVYLGKEANGGREGNQLTHGITTREVAAYGEIRPVQLYGAKFWRTRPASGTVSDPVLDGWSPGPFDAEDVSQFVRAQPEGEQTLVALTCALDAIGEPNASRVLFISTDLETVLRWLTAAMLLLPQNKAVRIGFKVFCTDPSKSQLPVLAIHPEWTPRIPVHNDRGYVVFDLGTGEHSQVPARPLIADWVHEFLTGDPWDVVDAVQVAGNCGLDDQPDAAYALAQAAVMRRVPEVSVAEPIVRWLREGPEPLRLAHAGDIALLFTEDPRRWPQGILRHLDAAGREGLLAGRAGAVRMALIRSEIAEANAGGSLYGALPQRLPPEEWSDAQTAAAEDLFVTELNKAVQPHVFNSLLCLAQRYRIPVTYSRIVDAGHRFIVDWANHPERPWRSEEWPCQAELEYQLIDELTMRVRDNARLIGPIGDRWWRRLLDRYDTLEPTLAATVLGSALKHSADRAGFARSQLTRARGNPSAYLIVVDGLWFRVEPSYDEMRLLAELTPSHIPLPDRLFEPALSDLLGAEELRRETVDLVREVVTVRRMVPAASEITRILEQDETVIAACAAEPRALPKIVKALVRIRPRVLTLHSERIAQALTATAARSPKEIDELMDLLRVHPRLLERYVESLARATVGGQWPAVFTTSTYICAVDLFRDTLQRTLYVNWVAWMSEKPKLAKQVRKELASYGPNWADRFDQVEDEARRNKWRPGRK